MSTQYGSELFSFKKSAISRLFKQANRIYKSNIVDILSDKKAFSFSRALIITPKRIGNAPKRNLLKRRARAIFYEEKLYLLPVDLVIILKKTLPTVSFAELKKHIIAAIKPIKDTTI